LPPKFRSRRRASSRLRSIAAAAAAAAAAAGRVLESVLSSDLDFEIGDSFGSPGIFDLQRSGSRILALPRARARACTFAPESDSRCSRARICFVKFHYVCPERIGVAPLSRSLASRTLVMPRSCLVNNCLIFSPSLLAPSLSRSLLRAHSLAARLAV